MSDFINIPNFVRENLPKPWVNDPRIVRYVEILCEFLQESNEIKGKLINALKKAIPEPNKLSLEAFFNDLYDPELRRIEVEGDFEITAGVLTNAGVNIKVPSDLAVNEFFPNDVDYIKILLQSLLPMGIKPISSSSVTTLFALALDDNDALALNDDYTLALDIEL